MKILNIICFVIVCSSLVMQKTFATPTVDQLEIQSEALLRMSGFGVNPTILNVIGQLSTEVIQARGASDFSVERIDNFKIDFAALVYYLTLQTSNIENIKYFLEKYLIQVKDIAPDFISVFARDLQIGSAYRRTVERGFVRNSGVLGIPVSASSVVTSFVGGIVGYSGGILTIPFILAAMIFDPLVGPGLNTSQSLASVPDRSFAFGHRSFRAALGRASIRDVLKPFAPLSELTEFTCDRVLK